MNDEHKLTGAYYPEVGIEKHEGKIPKTDIANQSESTSEALPVGGFFSKLLCKIGLHKLERKYLEAAEALSEGWIFWGPPSSHDECVRCGKRFEIPYIDGFDGTDNA